MTTFRRTFALDDIHIRSDGTGRTVEAYAAVFDTPTEIHDRDGHYLEQIAPTAFNKAIADAAPAGGRSQWLTKVMFNHGRDMYGNSAAEYALPIGTPVDIRADGRGLLTVTRYAQTRVANDVLELVREGAITGQSFQGRFLRSDKATPVGGFAPDASGALSTVTRQEVSLIEYGPTPFPAYQEAAIVGVRSRLADLLGVDPDALDDFLATRGTRADGASDTPTGAVEDEPQPHSSGFQLLSLRRMAREKGVL